jgi:glycosyltransferase involved in cell wall biosynthesis
MSLKTGGLERLLVDFSRFHDSRQFDLHFLSLAGLGQPASDIRDLGGHVESLERCRGSRVQRIWRLVRFLREHHIDVVHSHNTYAHFYAAIAAKLAGVRVIVNTQHGRGCGSNWKARAQFRVANRVTDRVLGVSLDSAQLCRAQDERSAARIDTIWNGIDLEKFAYAGPSHEPTAISVARLSPEKDFPTLLRAVSLAICEVPEFRLQIVGDGAERQRLGQLVHDLQLDGRVQFLGERNDVADLLPRAGFFVSSSSTEGISLTLLEAMAVGLPIVTTTVGGNPEIVDEGKTGRLVPAGDPERLAAAIVEMCHDREAWPAMGILARQRVERDFNVRSMVWQYEALYRELLVARHVQGNRA